MASLRFGLDDNPLAVEAAAGRPVALGKKLFEVPVRVRVPADGLVAGIAGHPAVVRIFLAAEDREGRRTLFKEKRIELPPRAAAAGGHELVVAMKLRAGPHRVAVGVRDEVAAVVSVVRLEIDVDADAAAPSTATVGATR